MNSMHSKQKTLLQAIVDGMIANRRRIAADWRILLIQRQATREIAADRRRWRKAWESPWEARSWILGNSDWEILRPLEECDSLFALGTGALLPGQAPLSAIDVLVEANPAATLSHITALHFHGLTEDMPGPIHLSAPIDRPTQATLCCGVSEEEWEELGHNAITYRKPTSIYGAEVVWHRIRNNRLIGIRDYLRSGSSVRAMTPERVLLEGLMSPEWCGGLSGVFKSWAMALDTIDLKHLIECAEAIGSAVLRQRAGFLLERGGVHHSTLDRWATEARGGGSAKLDPHAPFGSITQVDERWKISINTNLVTEGNP